MKSVIRIFSLSVCGIVFIALIVDLNSCEYFAEPEPFIDTGIQPLQIHNRAANFSNYSVDQIVSGTITLIFVPEWDPGYTDSVTAFVDSTRIAHYGQTLDAALPFGINTAAWPDGRHNIFVYAYKIPSLSDSLGVLSLTNNIVYIYRTSLIFDNTPPVPPANIMVTYQNKCALISWTPTNLSNFHNYVIRKNGGIIATIPSQNTSTYIDTTLPDFFNVYYEVGASTGQTTAYSDICRCKQGEVLSLGSADCIIDNLDDQVIFDRPDSLAVVSTQDRGRISQRFLEIGSSLPWAKSSNNDTIYCWDGSSTHKYLYTFEARTLDLVKKQQIDLNRPGAYNYFSYALAVGPGNEIYVSLAHDEPNYIQKNELFIFDKSLYRLDTTNSPIISFESICNFLNVSPDGRTLLAADDKGIKSYSLNNHSAAFSFQSSITEKINLFRADWKNSRLFITRQITIAEVWNAQTLNPINSFQLPVSIPTSTGITAIFANSKNLYVAYTISYFNAAVSLLAEYDVTAAQLVRSWTFPCLIRYLAGSDNGRYLFACTSTDQWIVDIGGIP